MNAVVEQQDAERMSARIEALEFLVRQQKDFIEESAITWRGLLEKEQALGAQGWRERNELDARFRALSDEQAAHVQKIHDLQLQVRKSRHEAADLKAPLLNAEHGGQESDQSQDRLEQLTDQLSKLDNMLRQRQEEIEQAWSALAEHRARVAELEANLNAAAEREAVLEQKLKDADSWVFKLAGERTEREKQLEILIRERNSTTEKLAVAHRQLSSLRERLDNLMAKPPKLAHSEGVVRLGNGVQDKIAITPPRAVRSLDALPTLNTTEAHVGNVVPAIDVLMKPVIERDKKMFLEKLVVTDNGSTQAASLISAVEPDVGNAPQQPSEKPEARSSSSQMPMRMAVPARNPQLERQIKAAELDIRWLRELSLACLDMPRRWSFLPLSWHMSRMKKRFNQKGLFDEQAYLSRYPDVAEASIDPLTHYLKHGMDEGRER